MKKKMQRKTLPFLTLVSAFSLLFSPSLGFAWEYANPPTNDISLYGRPPSISHQSTARKKKKKPRAQQLSRHYKKIRHAISRRKTGLFVYFPLPAPACCGRSCVLNHYHCCAKAEVWSKSYYASFHAAGRDLMYSDTNDDAWEKSRDWDWKTVGERSIEDPS